MRNRQILSILVNSLCWSSQNPSKTNYGPVNPFLIVWVSRLYNHDLGLWNPHFKAFIEEAGECRPVKRCKNSLVHVNPTSLRNVVCMSFDVDITALSPALYWCFISSIEHAPEDIARASKVKLHMRFDTPAKYQVLWRLFISSSILNKFNEFIFVILQTLLSISINQEHLDLSLGLF